MKRLTEKRNLFLQKKPILFLLLCAVVTSLFVSLFYFTAVSFIYPAYSHDGRGMDSYFYLLEGKLFAEGKIPYTEFFDHKGFLTILVNYLAYVTGGYYSLIVLNLITLTLSNFLLFLLAKEYFLSSFSLKEVLFSSVLIALRWAVVAGGNANGLFVLPFSALAYLFYRKGIHHRDRKRDFRLGTFLGGVAIAISFNRRPSDGLAVIPLYLYLLFLCLQKKVQVKELFLNILLALIGFLPLMAIVYGYAYHKGFFKPRIEAVFSGTGGYRLDSRFLLTTICCGIAILFFLLLGILVYRKRKKQNDPFSLFFLVTSAVSSLFNLVFLRFTNYWISYYPCFFLILLVFCHQTSIHYSFRKETKSVSLLSRQTIFLLCLADILSAAAFLGIYHLSGEGAKFSKAYSDSLDREIDENISKAEQERKDNVLVLDLSSSVQLKHNIETSLKYKAYQSAQAVFVLERNTAIIQYLEEKKPAYIIRSTDSYYTNSELSFNVYIDDNYEKRTDNYPDNQAEVLKRKN